MPKQFLVVLTTFVLAACGGGGGNTPVEDVRVLTGYQPPLETRTDQLARAAGIISRTDSLIASTSYGETTHPDVPEFHLRSTCSGTICTFLEPRSGLRLSISVNDLAFSAATETIALSKNGITLIGGENENGSAFGSWMQHSGFQVADAHETGDGITVRLRVGSVAGDLTGYHPSSTASWRGLMVGTPATGANRGDFLQGDARLTYSFSGTIDADFTNIKNVDRNRDHSVTRIGFDNVPVYTDGTFQAGLTGNRIQGGFYGPNHAETAGIFEQSNVIGSFGAKK